MEFLLREKFRKTKSSFMKFKEIKRNNYQEKSILKTIRQEKISKAILNMEMLMEKEFMNFKIKIYLKEPSKMEILSALEYIEIPKNLLVKENFFMGSQMAISSFNLIMGIYMMEMLVMENAMVMENIFILMGIFIKVNFIIILSQEIVQYHIRMVRCFHTLDRLIAVLRVD